MGADAESYSQILGRARGVQGGGKGRNWGTRGVKDITRTWLTGSTNGDSSGLTEKPLFFMKIFLSLPSKLSSHLLNISLLSTLTNEIISWIFLGIFAGFDWHCKWDLLLPWSHSSCRPHLFPLRRFWIVYKLKVCGNSVPIFQKFRWSSRCFREMFCAFSFFNLLSFYLALGIEYKASPVLSTSSTNVPMSHTPLGDFCSFVWLRHIFCISC